MKGHEREVWRERSGVRRLSVSGSMINRRVKGEEKGARVGEGELIGIVHAREARGGEERGREEGDEKRFRTVGGWRATPVPLLRGEHIRGLFMRISAHFREFCSSRR